MTRGQNLRRKKSLVPEGKRRRKEREKDGEALSRVQPERFDRNSKGWQSNSARHVTNHPSAVSSLAGAAFGELRRAICWGRNIPLRGAAIKHDELVSSIFVAIA